MAQLVQPSFGSGELSPSLHNRVDLARYLSGLKAARNVYVLPTGGAINRPGFRYATRAQTQSGNVRLVRFVFSTEQTYAIEFTAGSITIIADGARVLDGTSLTITNVQVSSQPTITTSGAHGLNVGDVVLISGVVGTGGASYANGEHVVTTVVDATNFRIGTGPTGLTGTYTSGGTVQPCVQVASPYTDAEVMELRTEQSADVLFVVHKNHPPYELRRTSATAWTFTAMEFEDGPFLDVNDDETIQVYASAATGTVTLTANANIFNADHVGALFYLEEKNVEEVPPWEAVKKFGSKTIYGLQRRSDGKVYRCVTTNTTADKATGSERPTHDKGVVADGDGSRVSSIPANVGVLWEYLHSGFGICRITTYTSPTQVTASVLSRLPDSVVGGAATGVGPWTMTGDGTDTTLSVTGATSAVSAQYEVLLDGELIPPTAYTVDPGTDVLTFVEPPANTVAVYARQLAANNRTDLWAFGAWSEDQGYPGAITFHEDRLIFAGSREQPQGIWASEVGDYTSFRRSVPLEDADALTTAVNARDVNAITDLVPLSSLIAGTSSGAWRVGPADDQALTPSTLFYKSQTRRGFADVPAIAVGETGVFVQYGGTKLRALAYQFETNAYTGDELTMLARHLFKSGQTITALASTEEPDNLIWAVRSDGAFASLTFVPEQQVMAWAQSSTDGLVRSVCSVPEDGRDVLYAVIRRTIGSTGVPVQYIERLSDRYETDWQQRMFVDSGLSYSGLGAGATLQMSWSPGASTAQIIASAGVFSAGMVGRELWLQGSDGLLKTRISTFNSALTVIVDLDTVPPPSLQNFTTVISEWYLCTATLTGLSHLIGRQVVAQTDGAVYGELLTVDSSGSVTLPYQTAIAHVGLPYDSWIETLPLTIVGRETIRWRQKTVPRVAVLMEDSLGFKAGPDADHLNEYALREPEDDYAVVEPETGLGEVQLSNTWEDTGQVQVWANRGAPLTILGVIPEVKVGT